MGHASQRGKRGIILCVILAVIAIRGAQALSWEMISSAPSAGFYMGKGGGILNAILGSFYLAIGGTILAAFIAAPAILYLHVYARPTRALAHLIRLALDVMWGIPSIVYGAFGFAVMMAVGLRASFSRVS